MLVTGTPAAAEQGEAVATFENTIHSNQKEILTIHTPTACFIIKG